MDRSRRASLGAQTLKTIEAGGYTNRHGISVDLVKQIAAAIDGTLLIRPADFEGLVARMIASAGSRPDRSPQIEVTCETTLEAARRLATTQRNVLALNFASAKNPGGGFLGGSRAQEESLARSSALYATLISKKEYYEQNRACLTAVYTDHVIYSPAVPVFRDDEGALLDEPYALSFMTAPAVNVSALKQQDRVDRLEIQRSMTRRVNNVLALAADQGHVILVLGAWGCGVFGNDPVLIADLFAKALAGPLGRYFERVVFAVFDSSSDQRIFSAFNGRFTSEMAKVTQ